jgi:hypothetical protein
MTTTVEPHTETRPVRDIRRIVRWFTVILMPLGPLAVAILRFALPYNTTDPARTTLAGIAAHPGRERLVLWLTIVAVLTLVPGAFAALKLASRSAPILTAAAALLIVPAYLSLFGVGLIDQVGLASTRAEISIPTATRIATIVNQQSTTVFLTVVFVAGHVFGTIVLAFALRRSRTVGLAGCLVLGVSQPIHFIAAVSGNHLLDLLGWTMTAVGMAAAGRAILALPIDDWNLPPQRPTRRPVTS